MSGVQEQLSSTVQQRLTATDAALRDGINQLLLTKVPTSPVFIDTQHTHTLSVHWQGFIQRVGGPGTPPPPENLYSQYLFSLTLMHDTVPVPHKLLPSLTKNPV